MYQGCKVIARHAPGPDAIITDSDTGYLVNNIEQMAQLILNDTKLDESKIATRVKEFFCGIVRQ